MAKCIILKGEGEENLKQLLDFHVAKLKPADDVEFGLVEEMVAAQWRMRRGWSIEANLFETTIEKRTESTPAGRVTGAFSELAAGNQLTLLDRYESRLHRMYQRSFKTLLELQEIEPDDDDTDLPNEPDLRNPDPEIQPIPNEPNSPNPDLEIQLSPNEPGSTNPDPEVEPSPNEPNSTTSGGAEALVRAQSPDCAVEEPEIEPAPNEPKPPTPAVEINAPNEPETDETEDPETDESDDQPRYLVTITGYSSGRPKYELTALTPEEYEELMN